MHIAKVHRRSATRLGRERLSLFLFGALLAPLLSVLGPSIVLAADSDATIIKLSAFLKRNCIDCHTGDDAGGGLTLESPGDLESAAKDGARWHKVRQKLFAGKMPPPDEPQPAKADVAEIIALLDRDILRTECGGTGDPGRVTMRRLNRREYDNTIRDLLGIDVGAGEEFPIDDLGYGFDNNGDVLTMSTLLLEKYLAAAEKTAEKAIVAKPLGEMPSRRFEGESFPVTKFSAHVGGAALLFGGGAATVECDFRESGDYVFQVSAFGQQAGDELPKMAIQVDGKAVRQFDVRGEADRPELFQARVRVEAGKRHAAVAFLNDYYEPDNPDPLRRDRNLGVGFLEVRGPIRDEVKELPKSHRAIVAATPLESGRSVYDCATDVFKPLADRAFRRPATEKEIERLAVLARSTAEQGATFEQAVQTGLQAILLSPHFLFKVEQIRPNEANGAAPKVDSWELAVRLSYFLWSTMPDKELFEEARNGTLEKNLDRQTKRMLADERSRALVDNFAGQWLELRKLEMVAPDGGMFPKFTPELRRDMRTETEMFFAEVMRKDMSVVALLDAPFTFLNQRLAEHYGIKGVKGEKFRRVELSTDQRGGVLTHASVLTVTSNPTRTSPVKRGKWIMEQILGTPPPPPPPDVEELPESAEAIASGSLRQRMEMHRSNASCASCHAQMDALGFGFENYDAIGRWRTKDGEFPVEPAGELPGGKSFGTPAELKRLLATDGRDAFVRCLAEKLLTYGCGRGMEFYDSCAIDAACKEAAEGDYRFSSLILATVHSDPFLRRRGDDDARRTDRKKRRN
jgi:hypothetical protein